ncbi:MAG: hypothetical protein IH600_16435 [Bacteroidetes bacterium]|nr:hypothetical protein [Bacteroidota bacterium]
MGKQKANEVKTPTESFNDPNAEFDAAWNRVNTGASSPSSQPSLPAVKTEDPNEEFDRLFDDGRATGKPSSEAQPSGVAVDRLPRMVRVAEKVNKYMAGIPERRRFRIYREGEGDVTERKTVHYSIPGIEEVDQHGNRHKLPDIKAVWRNYDPDTGEPLRDFELEKIPDGAKIDSEESFKEADLSPYYHAAKRARSTNKAVDAFNDARPLLRDLLSAVPNYSSGRPGDMMDTSGLQQIQGRGGVTNEASDFSPMRSLLQKGVRDFVLNSPVDIQRVDAPRQETKGDRLQRQEDRGKFLGFEKGDIKETAKKVGRDVLDLAMLGATEKAFGVNAVTPDQAFAGNSAVKDLVDIYYNPSNAVEYWLGNAGKIATTYLKYATGAKVAETALSQGVSAITKGIVNPGGIIQGGAVTDLAEILNRAVLAPMRGLTPMGTEEAREWIQKTYPKMYTGGMTDDEMRDFANAVKRVQTMTLENEAVADGKWSGLDLVPTEYLTGFMRTRQGKMATKGLVDWMNTMTFGGTQTDRDLDTINAVGRQAFSYDGGDEDSGHMMNDFRKASERLEPQDLWDVVWQGVGGAAPMLPFFAKSLEKAGGKAFPMLDTLKKVGLDVQGVVRAIPGATKMLMRDIGMAGVDTGLFALRAHALGLAQWSDTDWKDAHQGFKTLLERGATPVQALVNSYGMRLGSKALENFTEAGHLELFRASRALTDGALRRTAKAMLAMLNEGLEERGADWGTWVAEELTDLPDDLRQQLADPAELNLLKSIISDTKLDDKQMEKAIGDFLISGILGIGMGAMRVGVGGLAHPISTPRKLFRDVKNGFINPRQQAEEYAKRYSFDINAVTGERLTPEQYEEKVDALTKLIQLNSFKTAEYGMDTIAKSFSIGLHSPVNVDGLIESEGIEKDPKKWFMSKEELTEYFPTEKQRLRKEWKQTKEDAKKHFTKAWESFGKHRTKAKDATAEAVDNTMANGPSADIPSADSPSADSPSADAPPKEPTFVRRGAVDPEGTNLLGLEEIGPYIRQHFPELADLYNSNEALYEAVGEVIAKGLVPTMHGTEAIRQEELDDFLNATLNENEMSDYMQARLEWENRQAQETPAPSVTQPIDVQQTTEQTAPPPPTEQPAEVSPLDRILDENVPPDAPPPSGPEDDGWHYQLQEEPSRVAHLQQESGMDLLSSDPSFAEEIENDLREKYPSVNLGTIHGEMHDGKPVLGRANTKAMQALYDPELAKRDTIPHEYLHLYVDLFKDSDIVKAGLEQYGDEEALVQAAGSDFAERKDDGFIKTWLKDFLNWLKGIFGKQDAAYDLARRFDSGKDSFSFVSRAKAVQREAGWKYQEGEAKPHHMPKRESFIVLKDNGTKLATPGYRVSIPDVDRGFFVAHPTVEGKSSSKWILYDEESGLAATAQLPTRADAIAAFTDLLKGDPTILQKMEEEAMQAMERQVQASQMSATYVEPAETGTTDTKKQSASERPYAFRRLSYQPLAGTVERATDMQTTLERIIGGDTSLSDRQVRDLLAMRDERGRPPIDKMVEMIDLSTDADYDEEALRSWLIANHKRQEIPLVSVSIPDYGPDPTKGQVEHSADNPVMIDVAPAGSAQYNGEGDLVQTFRQPSNMLELTDVRAFLDAYGLTPNGRMSGPVGEVTTVRVGGKVWNLGVLAARRPVKYSRMEATLAEHGIYMMGSGGKNEVFPTINLDPSQPISQKAAQALLTAMDATEEYWKKKIGADVWRRSATGKEFAVRRERMQADENGNIDVKKMTPHDRMFAVYAAYNQWLQDETWAGNGNKIVKYGKELTSADKPTVTTEAVNFIDELREGIEKTIPSLRGKDRRLMEQVRDGLRILTPSESELAARMALDGKELLAGGLVIDRKTGDIDVATAFVDHDHYEGKTPHGDGGNVASPLVSLFLSYFQGGDERAKLLKPRIISPGTDFSLLVKSMLDVMDGQMLSAAHAVGVGLLVFDSSLKLGKSTIANKDEAGQPMPLPKYSTFEQTALSNGKVTGIPVRRVPVEKFTLVNDPEGKEIDDTTLGMQGMAAVPTSPMHFPHLADNYDAMRDFYRMQSQRTVDLIKRFNDDAAFRTALYRRLARNNSDPGAAPFVAMIEEAGRNVGPLYYLPHLQIAFNGAAHSHLLSAVSDKSRSGSSRVIGQSLKLTPDFGTATGTNMLAVQRANNGDVESLRKYFDIEDIFPIADRRKHLTPEQQKILRDETAKLIVQRDTIQKDLVALPPSAMDQVAKLNKQFTDVQRRIDERSVINEKLIDSYLAQNGYRRVGQHYVSGTGHLKETIDVDGQKAVPIIVNEETARKMGWKPGTKVLVTAIPADAPHSTKACVIAGVSNSVAHRMTWSALHTINLGKDHDGDALYVRGASDGYWREKARQWKNHLDGKYTFVGKEAPQEDLDLLAEYNAYADAGWKEMPQESFEKIWTLFADPQVQSYATDLYKKFKIPGAFTDEASRFMQSIFGAKPMDNVPTPLDTFGRRWLVANYVGETAGVIGKVAAARRQIAWIVQAFPELLDTDAPTKFPGATRLDLVDMATTILVNHAVDAPAQEHLFSYNFDPNQFVEWAIRMLAKDEETQDTLSNYLGAFKDAQVAVRGVQNDKKMASAEHIASLHAMSNLESLEDSSIMSAFVAPFGKKFPLCMSADFYKTIVAPQVVRHMVQSIFGPQASMAKAGMVEKGKSSRDLTELQKETVFGMIMQAWEEGRKMDNREVEDNVTREMLRGPVTILTHMTAAMEFSREALPVPPQEKDFMVRIPGGKVELDVASFNAAQETYEGKVKQLRDAYDRFGSYNPAYFDNPMQTIVPHMLDSITKTAWTLQQPRVYMTTGLEKSSGYQFAIDRNVGLSMSVNGEAFVPVSPKALAAFFTGDPRPMFVAARKQIFDIMLEAARLGDVNQSDPLHLLAPAEANRMMEDMVETYLGLQPEGGEQVARHHKLSDALLLSLMQERFLTLQPYQKTAHVELRQIERSSPLARTSYQAVGNTAGIKDDGSLPELGDFGTAARLNVLAFRYLTPALRSRFLEALNEVKAVDVWFKSMGDEMAVGQPTESDVATGNDRALQEAEDLDYEIAAADGMASDLIRDLQDNEVVVQIGPDKMAARVVSVRSRLENILDLIDDGLITVDDRLKKNVRIAVQGLNAFGAASGIASLSLRGLVGALRGVVKALRKLSAVIHPYMVSGNIHREAPIRTWNMTDRVGVNLRRALFSYAGQRVRIFSNSVQDLLSYTREGMTGWFRSSVVMSDFDMVLAAMRAMGYEVSTARRMFTDTVRAQVGEAWGHAKHFYKSENEQDKYREWMRDIVEEMHDGALLGLRLIHNGEKWMWLMGKDTTFEYSHLDPNSTDFDGRILSFLSKEMIDKFGNRRMAIEAARLIMRLRRMVAENASNVLHNHASMLEDLAAMAKSPSIRDKYIEQAKSYKAIIKTIQAGKPYFPLSYNNMAAAVVNGEADNHIEMLAATASAEYFAANPPGDMSPEQVAELRDAIQTKALLDAIYSSGLGGQEIVRSILQKPKEERLEAAKRQMAVLFENSHVRLGGGYLEAGMDSNAMHRAVNYRAVRESKPEYTGLKHDPEKYVTYDIIDSLDKMMDNHLNGMLGTYWSILHNQYVKPASGMFEKASEEIERRVAEVFHMNIYTKVIPWSRLVRGDDINMTIQDPEEIFLGDVTDTIWHERTMNVRVHRVLAGRNGENAYIVGMSGQNGPVYWLVDPHADSITLVDEDGNPRQRRTRDGQLVPMVSKSKLDVDKKTGLVAFHTKVRDYIPWKEERMRRRANASLKLANDDAYLTRMRAIEKQRREMWKKLNTIGGFSKLGFNPPSVVNNSKYYLASAWWHTGKFIPVGQATMKQLQGMIGEGRTEEQQKIGEMLARALDALPNMYDWRFFTQATSIGAEVDDATMAKSWLQIMSDFNEAMEMASVEAQSRGLDGQRSSVFISQKASDALFKKYGHRIEAYFSKAGMAKLYATTMGGGYWLFQKTESFNRNIATITTLFQTHSFMGQFYDPLGTGEAGKFAQLPAKAQAILMRQWVLYARQQDENINYDYSRIMRPKWLRAPMMEFMGKFAIFSNAAWSQRLQNISEARKLYSMGRSADMLFADERGRLGSNRKWWKSRMNSKTFISAADIPASEWSSFVKNVYGFTDEEGIESACNRIAEMLEKEGITVEAARFNPLARAVRFSAIYPLQMAVRAYLWNAFAMTVEPMSDFVMGWLDLFDMFGPPDDEDELQEALASIYPDGDPFWDNPDNLDAIFEDPLYKQYREKKFESILNRLTFSSPAGGLVISQALKWMGAYTFGPLAGADYRPKPPELLQNVFRMASTRTFMEYLSDVLKGPEEGKVEDFFIDLFRGILPTQFTYWEDKMRQEAKNVLKTSYPLANEKDAGGGMWKTSRVDPVEKQAKANIQRVRNESRKEGIVGVPVLDELSAMFVTKGDMWLFMGDRDRTQLNSIYVMFERARLGSPDAYENIMSDPVKYPPQAFDAWLKFMKERKIPATMDPKWVAAYMDKAWPEKRVENVEVRNIME